MTIPCTAGSTNNEKEDADNKMHSRGDRMDQLLSAVQRAIKIKKENFRIFLDVLENAGEGKYMKLVKKMRGGPASGMECEV